jgi:polyhydroxybutyrate depolymerase
MNKSTSLLLLLMVLIGCNRNEDLNPVKEFSIDGTLSHDGFMRTFRVHLPSGYYEATNNLPLVLALHGGGGSAEQFEAQSELNEKSDTENFIVVYPEGRENPNLPIKTWNAGKCCGQNASTRNTDDVGFIAKLIDHMVSEYKTDSKKVYATGHSNGAMMCYRLADEIASRLAAIAPNAGNFQIKSPYSPSRNVPVLHIASVLDDNVIYSGGMTNGPGGQYNPPVDSCLNVIASLAGCTQSKQIVKSTSLYTQYKWSNCTSNAFEVHLYLTQDGGHSWAGGNKGSAFADEPSKAFVNNDIIWDFFKQHTLP